jgi:hypothetical protein
VEQFLQEHPAYTMQEEKTIFPYENGGDGFFMVALVHTNPVH